MANNNNKYYASADGRSAEDRAFDRFTEMVIEKVEAIQSDWKKPWFTENTLSFPKNLSGREYNGMNAFMLLLHCEDAGYQIPVFMTFEQVRGLNYKGNTRDGVRLTDKEGQLMAEVSVLKGAKSFPVFRIDCTVIHAETKEKIKFDDYKKLSKAVQAEYNVYPHLQVYNVFNVDQTNIKEVRPELYTKLKEENVALPPELSADGYCFPAMDEMIKNNEWLCPIYLKHQNEAYYEFKRDEIILPEKEQFYDPESFYGTGLHEMIHSTAAENRLNRFKDVKLGEEELIAELGSALVMQKNGICKTIKEESCQYLKYWLTNLKESPAYLKKILFDVKRASAMVNEKIEAINLRLSETISEKQVGVPLLLTGIPDGAVSEFHMLDNESRDAVYRLLVDNLYDKDTGNLVKGVSKPADRIVRVDEKYLEAAVECVYDCLDSETLSKIVSSGSYFEGHLIEDYQSHQRDIFTQEFERRRNDSSWLKEQGIEGEVKWNLNFLSLDGYFLAKAISGEQSKLGAMDHHCSIFRPFVDIGKNFSIEDDLGYMSELRRRLLSKDEKVDPLGRISFAAPPIHYPETGNIRRDILIDGEANAVFVLEPNSDIYALNFMLELRENDQLKSGLACSTNAIMHDEENNIYYTKVDKMYDLFKEKDRFYPVRFISDEVNMAFTDYWNLLAQKKTEPAMQVKNDILDRVNEKVVLEKREVHSGLFAFKSNDGLWGLHDREGRVLVPARWESLRPKEGKEGNEGIVFTRFVYTDDRKLPDVLLFFHTQDLANMADKYSRLSNVRIESRGGRNERWIAADVDGKPVVSEKVTDADWHKRQNGISSTLELAMNYFSTYIAHPKDEQMQTGVRMK